MPSTRSHIRTPRIVHDAIGPDGNIVRQFSHPPTRIYGATIPVSGLSEWKLPQLQPRRASSSSLGNLDQLPLELVHECMTHMDLLSLTRFCRVSARGLVVVRALVMLKNFIAHARHIPKLLAKARILGRHSLAMLDTALHSDRCTLCGAYGAFLHLLSARRCCYPCSQTNTALWMLSLPKAKKYFGLTDRQLRSLPSMWSIPGEYGHHSFGRRNSRRKPTRLTSVREAKMLALRVHGRRSYEAFQARKEDDFECEKITWYRQASLATTSPDPLTIDDWFRKPIDKYDGMGIVPFPSVVDNGRVVEHGHVCLGCEEIYTEYVCDELDERVLERIVPEGCNIEVYLSRVEDRIWSTAGLVRHVKDCHHQLLG